MNIEKLVNGKFYRGFEWFYRLILLNLLILIVSFSLPAIPFVYWVKNFMATEEKGFIVIISLALFVIGFIPAFISSFMVIKHYMEERTGNIFVLYFRNLIDTIKRIYLIEIILVPVFMISIYGVSYWWFLLGPDYYDNNLFGLFSIVAFVVEFFILVGLLLMFINLTYLIVYFRMKTFDYIKASFKFSFRYMGQTLLSILILFIPFVLLFWLGMRFLPLYFISGFTLPQFFMFFAVRGKFSYLSKNVDDINTENILE